MKLSELVVVGLFKKFQARYPYKWASAIKGIEAIAVNEWAIVLGGLNPEQIDRGLSDLPDDWPPAAGEFKKLCIGNINEGRIHSSHRENRVSHMIESDEMKENRKKHGAKFAEDAKAILKGKKNG